VGGLAAFDPKMRKRDDMDRLHDEIRELVDDLWQVPRFVAASGPTSTAFAPTTRRRCT
jgi:hypothetical protein